MRLKWNAFGAVIILFAFVLIHERLEELSLNIGLSWTFSKIAPYLMQFIVIVLLSAVLAQLFGRNFGRKKLILLSSIILFSGISFAVNPIYEGDFDNTYEELIVGNIHDEFKEGLTMVALPGCPYCFERIETLNNLKKHQKDLPIYVVILNSDTSIMSQYSEKLSSDIKVLGAQNSKQLNQVVRGSFPAFIFSSKENRTLYFWSQVGFGSGAMDWLSEKY